VRLTRTEIGGQALLQGTVRDMTEQKQAEVRRAELEEQLQSSQKMEAIGSLAGGVAHDFNNLLTVILSYLGFAMSELQDDDPIKEDLLEVQKAGERAATLTRQLLAFSRRQVLQPVPLDLNQIATGLEKMLRRILGEDIDFVQELAPDLGVVVADPGQVEQVLMNLVVNARDAMPEGGRLTIATCNVELDASHASLKPGPYVQISVSDTGWGMDEQTRRRLFEPFFTTKEKGKGTGLGLPTVYGIVKQSGGEIRVSSEPGRGTSFEILLPRELSARAVPTVIPSKVPGRIRGTETILIVEDEEALRKVAARTLDKAGYKVLTAGDGTEALLKSEQYADHIDLVVTDVVMPGIGGRTLSQEFSKRRPTTKILYMSGYTDDTIVYHGVLEAGTHFLGKPFTEADLSRKIREVLDSGSPDPTDASQKADQANAEQNTPLLDQDALQGVDPDILDKLRKAVVAARYGEIVQLVETIRGAQPEVAAELRRMADLFDQDGMRHILGQ
jgi:signal transduction histidine kinase/CheY-like chemotaxis protein